MAVRGGRVLRHRGHIRPSLPGDHRVAYRATGAESTAAAAVEALLGALDAEALRRFPDWLPGAAEFDGPAGLNVAAVRALALRHAATHAMYGPFLADLAERALRRQPTGAAFPMVVRAAGLGQVLGAGQPAGAPPLLLVDIADGLSAAAETALVLACERVAEWSGLDVWLSGAPLRVVDRIGFVDDPAPSVPRQPVPAERPAPPGPGQPPRAGRPRPGSRAEQLLENVLVHRTWATGRAWNQTFQAGPLTSPVVVDLLFADERCAVEIDGPEHADPAHLEADHRRDLDLHLAGWIVARFTNAQVEHDVEAVVASIGRLLATRQRAQHRRAANPG